MNRTAHRPRHAWQSLTSAQKQARLAGLRRHQQHEIELDLRLLRHLR